MRCEVCGREIIGPPQRRIIEGAKLTVCPRCAAFGTDVWTVGKQPSMRTPKTNIARTQAQRRPILRNDVETVEQFDFIENYGAEIRKARQRLGLSEKDLAMKMQEKESVIKKLEKEELTPDLRNIQKIKRYLNLDIVERAETEKGPILAKPTGPKTIGDMLKMESEKKETQS